MMILSLIYFILSNAVASSKNIAILYSRSTLLTYFFLMLFVYSTFDFYFFDKSISLYNGLIYCSLVNLTFIFFIFLLSLCILLLTSFYPSQSITSYTTKYINTENLFPLTDLFQKDRDHYKIIEYPLIIQFILIGSITLLSSNDLITIFLSIELQSYGLYILSSIYRNSESSTSAGLTYFLLGGLSSCIILLGQSFLYVNSGTTNLDGLYLIHNIITSDQNLFYSFFSNQELINNTTSIFTLNSYQYSMQFSLIILSVGFLFKISAAPFHS
jgi:NADH-ubiquinone oxidoreductase chain 2